MHKTTKNNKSNKKKSISHIKLWKYWSKEQPNLAENVQFDFTVGYCNYA